MFSQLALSPFPIPSPPLRLPLRSQTSPSVISSPTLPPGPSPHTMAPLCSGTVTAGGVVGWFSSTCRNQYGAISRVKITADSCTLAAYNGPNCPSREFETTYGYGTNTGAGGVAYQSFKVNCV